jgi:site-specific recombinase XerD
MSKLLLPKLTTSHAAYLRSISEGIDPLESGRRYLGLSDARQLEQLNTRVVNLARVVAKRMGLKAWRLIGRQLHHQESVPTISLEDWAMANGVGFESEQEQQRLYLESLGGAISERRTNRVAGLLEARLHAIKQLEQQAVAAPSLADPIEAWFAAPIAERLAVIEVRTLYSLQALIVRGGRWWSDLSGFGIVKAQALEETFRLLVPTRAGGLEFSRQRLVDFDAELQLVNRWVEARARAGSATARGYVREGVRFLLFLRSRDRNVMNYDSQDCKAYMDFLEMIPDAWISRKRAKPMEPGWAPFRGQLSSQSRHHAIVVAAAMAEWFVRAGFVERNPWVLVNKRTEQRLRLPGTKAWKLDELRALVAKLLETVDGRDRRAAYVLALGAGTGLRPAELVAARFKHVHDSESGKILAVVGKGGRARLVPLSNTTVDLLVWRLGQFDVRFDAVDGEWPLVSRVSDPAMAAAYRPLVKSIASCIKRAVGKEVSGLHFLRHTFATNFVRSKGRAEILQLLLGHSSLQTTAIYYNNGESEGRQVINEMLGEGGLMAKFNKGKDNVG